MTNRDYLRNILNQLAGEVAALRPTPKDELVASNVDLYHLQVAINEASDELARLDADNIEEAYDIKPLYDRIKVIIAHERVIRNHLDRVALAADNAIDLCNLLSVQVEEESPPEDDSL